MYIKCQCYILTQFSLFCANSSNLLTCSQVSLRCAAQVLAESNPPEDVILHLGNLSKHSVKKYMYIHKYTYVCVKFVLRMQFTEIHRVKAGTLLCVYIQTGRQRDRHTHTLLREAMLLLSRYGLNQTSKAENAEGYFKGHSW